MRRDKNEDAQLVNRFLDGDESAFTELVKKYQKRVHALAWRKVGDFHIAEELTQDAFLKVYQKLPTLKNPNQFAGWLYVITDRLCIAWQRKQKPQMESLETTSREDIDESSCRFYEDEQLKEADVEFRRSLIKNLLEELPESERTVVTLHYLGEMKCKEISEFLGVSVNTVKSRLQRARNRLKDQEAIIRETFGSVQLPVNMIENITRQIADIKPTVPTSGKPLVPWVFSAATAIFIFLIIGGGSPYLARFQRPYNINAPSETTVEIIDAPLVLDIQAKPDLRNQAGRLDTTGQNNGAGPQLSEPVTLGAAQVEKEPRPSTQQQWVQTSGPEGGLISNLLLSATGDIYAASPIGIYRLAPNAPAWTLINTTVQAVNPINSKGYDLIPMAEHNDTLYLVSIDEVLTSTDRGEHWKSLGTRPKGRAIGLAITDEGLYLALENQIFRSENAGKRWFPMNDGIADRNTRILALAAIENTMFTGTNHGLYRSRSGMWEKSSVDTTKAIHSLAVSGNSLYVGTGPNPSQLKTSVGIGTYLGQVMRSDKAGGWEVFHSTDLGDTWTEITPTCTSFITKISPGVKLMAAGETLLALGTTTFRSTDRGKTWTGFGFDPSDRNALLNSVTLSVFPAAAVDQNTFLKVGLRDGLIRSTDGGKSWHSFTKGIVGSRISNLIVFKNALYLNTGLGIAKSADSGNSWKTLPMDSTVPESKPLDTSIPTDLLLSAKLAISGGVLYGIAPVSSAQKELHLFRLSASGDTLVPIQVPPAFGRDLSIMDLIGLGDGTRQSEKFSGAFVVSGETFYTEFGRQLFRWKCGELEWFRTGLIDTDESSKDSDDGPKELKLAVLEKTVYAGKRDGHLFQSLDSGNTWKDLTANLPLRFERFNDITFAGSTVYVATDAGVLVSENGEHWRATTDKTGIHTLIDQIAVDTPTVYGASNEGVYRLNNRDEWEKILSEVPDSVTDLAVNNNKLYITTKYRGMFHISVEKE
ncbi:sigma-70 family RNA polymerase sigma factor [Candidatus Poribacteria bacterium]|nr:sigma-70 family RNA polymerase sigma factor [Candidatus Poribacteria bacterium]MYH82101.1 sigma-70 family RNA polymerase sigma factor [Candidatus Poribacteria bacterium]MYK95313.1 sigma-70 family RNA polymerase sigma factor [Candidatus Poribacteria bacterium]